MNRMILRFIYVCILLNCVAGCAITAGTPSTESTKNATLEVNKQSNESLFVDMCRYGFKDYKRLKKRFEDRFNIGADANSLIIILEVEFEKRAYDQPFLDPLYHKEGEKPKANSRFFGYTKRCEKDAGNIDMWSIVFFTDPNYVITATEFRLIFDDENFALRKIPFNFDHFYNDSAQKALWSLTGKGATREEVEALMSSVQEGEYGEFLGKQMKKDGKILIYRYYLDPKISLVPRLALYEFISQIIWEFDDHDQLIKLTIKV